MEWPRCRDPTSETASSCLVTVPLLAVFLWWPGWELGYAIAFVIYCLMGVTDYFDGLLLEACHTVVDLYQ